MTTEERKAEDARFRQEYPLFAQYPELIYLDNAATTQKPSCVIQAESAFYEKYNANPFRGVYELAEFATEHYEEARAAVAELLHANTDEIVFTRNASESLNLIAYSLGNLVLRPGDEVLVSIMEHHSNLLVWQQAAKRTGATLRYLDCTQDGKITAAQIEETVKKHYEDGSHEHMVQPGMVYISFPTESGTLYSKQELTDIYAVCKALDMPLFIDGARLGYGLQSLACDVTLPELANLCDVFYIGGTKCGALFGEAVVILKESLKKDFRYMIKQRGGMFAKGRLLGIQFDTLFTDGLYETICFSPIFKGKIFRQFFFLCIC